MPKSKVEQYNQSFKKALGAIIYKLVPDVPNFSVTDVLIEPSLQHGRVWLHSTPEGFKQIEEKRVEIQANLKKYVKTRYTPRLVFLPDDNYLDHLNSLFSEINEPKKNED